LWRWVDKFREFQCRVHHIAGSKNTVADALSRVQGVKADAQEAWSLDFVRKQQDSCPTLSKIKFFYKELPKLSVGKDGILRHSCSDDSGSEQIVISRNLPSRALQMMHDELGHFGTAKTSARVKERFFWPSM